MCHKGAERDLNQSIWIFESDNQLCRHVFAQVLVGHPDYEVTGGSMRYKGQDLLEFEPEERCHLGLFMRLASFHVFCDATYFCKSTRNKVIDVIAASRVQLKFQE